MRTISFLAILLVALLIFFVVNLKFVSERLTSQSNAFADIEGRMKNLMQENVGLRKNNQFLSERLTEINRTMQISTEKATCEVVQESNQEQIPVLVMTFNRPDYLAQTLKTLIAVRPSNRFPVIVSQDGDDKAVKQYVSEGEFHDEIIHIQHLTRKPLPPNVPVNQRPYYFIAQHYHFALSKVFDVLGFNQVIIVEDDLQVSKDFFEYFEATLELLKKDPSIWCVSGWNDQGKNVKDSTAVRRTNFFPGLGWMLRRTLWEELRSTWPVETGYWDDWMREPPQRKGRDCIYPEISRTHTFGQRGSSIGQFYEEHLKYIKLSEGFVPFKKMNLDYLLQQNWPDYFQKLMQSNNPLEISTIAEGSEAKNRTLILPYISKPDFEQKARALGLMTDFKAGVPRGGYNGIVMTYSNDNHLFLVPRGPVLQEIYTGKK